MREKKGKERRDEGDGFGGITAGMWLNVNALELSEDDFSRSHCIVRGVLLTGSFVAGSTYL